MKRWARSGTPLRNAYNIPLRITHLPWLSVRATANHSSRPHVKTDLGKNARRTTHWRMLRHCVRTGQLGEDGEPECYGVIGNHT